MKTPITLTHVCGHEVVYADAKSARQWEGGECRACYLAERPHAEALALDTALAAGGRLAKNGKMFYRFGGGEVHVGGDVRALGVIVGGAVYVVTPPQDDRPYISLEDVCKRLGFKRERRTSRSVRALEIEIAFARRAGWKHFQEALADLWPGEPVVTFRAQTDDGYYRLIYIDGPPQIQIATRHRDATDAEWATAKVSLDAACAEAKALAASHG